MPNVTRLQLLKVALCFAIATAVAIVRVQRDSAPILTWGLTFAFALLLAEIWSGSVQRRGMIPSRLEADVPELTGRKLMEGVYAALNALLILLAVGTMFIAYRQNPVLLVGQALVVVVCGWLGTRNYQRALATPMKAIVVPVILGSFVICGGTLFVEAAGWLH